MAAAGRRVAGALRRILGWSRRPTPRAFLRQRIDAPVASRYLITSERGVHLLAGDELARVAELPSFGIAIAGDDVYLADSTSSQTGVLRTSLATLLDEAADLATERLFSQRILTSNERIHQICLAGDALWVANTARNTLLRLDRRSGAVGAEIAPFLDRFGDPVLHDQNHLNSVCACGDALLFVAYRAGPRSLIGLVADGQVVGFGFPHVGVHDIHIAGGDVIFSDTFGAGEDADAGGAPFVNGKPLDPGFFAAPPGCVVRGVAGGGGQLVIGHSHKGIRQKRFEGRAGLLVAEGGRIVARSELPFSQFYDVVQLSGRKFDEPPAVQGFAEIRSLLAGVLGPPVYEGEARTL
jgi:hypothetical protein